jgi:hypothetical protein
MLVTLSSKGNFFQISLEKQLLALWKKVSLIWVFLSNPNVFIKSLLSMSELNEKGSCLPYTPAIFFDLVFFTKLDNQFLSTGIQ